MVTVKDLEGAKKVIVEDLTEYVPGLSSNGGQYIYKIIFHRIDNKEEWEIQYETSAEFDYCDVLGSFQSCHNCPSFNHGTGFCEEDYEIITTNRLLEKLNYYEKNKNKKYHPDALGGYDVVIL